MTASGLAIEDLHARLGGQRVVNGVSLTVEPGALFCLLGPSGCGKTTLLRLIGGYLAPEREPPARIRLGERDLTHAPPERRNVATVFQDYALFPHLTARRNVAFGLEVRGVPAAERARRVDAMLERVGLTREQADRRPAALSGGQRQRVALARALVVEPELLLLDEPLANLDRRLRDRMRGELRELQQRSAVTTLLVTHDQEEALALATQIGVMVAGRLLQVGAPDELYRRPRTPFVARFLGDANLLEVDSADATTLRCRGGIELARAAAPDARAGDRLLVRPESVRLGRAAAASAGARSGTIRASSYLGVDRFHTIELDGATMLRARERSDGGAVPIAGAAIPVALDPAHVWRIPEPDPDWLRRASGAAGDELAASP